MHLTRHLFDDIESKGATRNYTSKTFEKLHGPLGETYERLTNFKGVVTNSDLSQSNSKGDPRSS